MPFGKKKTVNVDDLYHDDYRENKITVTLKKNVVAIDVNIPQPKDVCGWHKKFIKKNYGQNLRPGEEREVEWTKCGPECNQTMSWP
jgi:hypothetical protein